MFSVPFEPRHLKEIDARNYEERFLGEIGGLAAHAAELARSGPAFSFVEGRIVGAGGIIRLHRGVGEAWLALSKDFTVGAPSKRWARLTWLLEMELSRLSFHRLQTAIPVDFEPGHKFARHMGFRSEGVMRKYGFDGSDFERFARIS